MYLAHWRICYTQLDYFRDGTKLALGENHPLFKNHTTHFQVE
jgi:hypothetical protein